jgi:hypothetical protein
VQAEPLPANVQLGALSGPKVPCAGMPTTEKFTLELSTSDAESVIAFAVSLLVVTD